MSPVPDASRQLLLCLAPDWDASRACLQRFERRDNGCWLPVGQQISVTLGRAGLAWGRGLHSPIHGLAKQEGDGRAPAGVFAISSLFGYAASESVLARSAKLPYQQSSTQIKAIDDPASRYYNQIVDLRCVAEPDWRSCEDMLRSDVRYALGAVVAHNAEPAVPGAGSCIFLHVWEKKGAPTAGCTAMSLAAMTEIAGWLDGAASPVLVQLPQMEYERLRADWWLPAFVAHG
jgi:L,D-peptidoglycan transpeptidase YkuD (ErfK/YbiS/YcfS/YnhG family)